MQDVLIHFQHHTQYLNLNVICKHVYTLYFWRSVLYYILVKSSYICAHESFSNYSRVYLFCRKNCYYYDAGNVILKLKTEFFWLIFHFFFQLEVITTS